MPTSTTVAPNGRTNLRRGAEISFEELFLADIVKSCTSAMQNQQLVQFVEFYVGQSSPTPVDATANEVRT